MKEYRDVPVLITGGEGFIGSHLARRLWTEDARVSVLVHPRASLHRLADLDKSIRLFPCDVRNGPELARIVAEVNARKIFHLAAVTDVGRDWKKFDDALAVNLGGTLNLLQSLPGTECDALVCVCTAEVYGSNTAPFREDMAPDPVSPYSLSKAAATQLCRMAARTRGLPAVVLRLFLAYGPGQGPERFLPQLIRAGLSGDPFTMTAGEQTREFTYIDDVVEGFLIAAGSEKARGEIFNLGSGQEISLRDLVKRVGALLGKDIIIDPEVLPYRDQEIFRCVGDHGKIRRVLGWEAKIDLDNGLRETIKWYMANQS